MSDRWGPDGPPPEAYSRVTDAERFRPLHAFALELLDDLERRCDVVRTEGVDADGRPDDASVARPTVALTPADPSAAPIVVAFTPFPGLLVRFGMWLDEGYPPCGCDACDEQAGGEIERLRTTVDAVVEGRFIEAFEKKTLSGPWIRYSLGEIHPLSGRHRSSGGTSVEPARARELIARAGGRTRLDWKPWPPRT